MTKTLGQSTEENRTIRGQERGRPSRIECWCWIRPHEEETVIALHRETYGLLRCCCCCPTIESTSFLSRTLLLQITEADPGLTHARTSSERGASSAQFTSYFFRYLPRPIESIRRRCLSSSLACPGAQVLIDDADNCPATSNRSFTPYPTAHRIGYSLPPFDDDAGKLLTRRGLPRSTISKAQPGERS